jgi:hypothetical protein
MAEALKRLGGGRWQTRDSRFTIEPESGTWVIVDAEQTDELGLPLVRGPFASLTAAKEAIEDARESRAAESPLAERLAQAKTAPTARDDRKPKAEREPPPPPPEPKWLRDLPAKTRREADALIARLERDGVEDAERVARAEIADDEPALARLALERRLAEAAAEDDPRSAVEAVIDALVEGRDRRLDARWRLVDGDDREIRRLELPAAGKASRR